MKKAILCAVALLFGTFAFAQDIAGSPTSALVPALAGSAAGANTGLSIQNGDDNRVRVRQAGTSQSAYTNQDNGSGVGGNLARVRQTGSVQSASGVENATDVLQSGSYNQSTTRQEGDYNNAVTRQGQNDDSSSGNKAKIQQGVADQAEGNRAAIDQDGDDNQAQTLQTYDNSDAWTRQVGDENKSMIVQNAGPNGSDGHEASNWQGGDRNESSIDQSGAGGRNVALTAQAGDDNQAKQKQTTTAGAGMTGNRGVILQGYPSPFTMNSVVPVMFDLSFNANGLTSIDSDFSWDLRESVGAKAKQTQNGKQNEADIYQNGGEVGNSNYAEQEQAWGWGNDAAIIQNHYGSGNNYAKQFQAGDHNDAAIGQTGNSHKGLQTQIGHRNRAISTQAGSANLVNVHQRGNDNVANSGQRGLSNAALIVQRDGQSYTALQNMDLGEFDVSAGDNQIDVLQLGPDGNFATDGIDCDFEDPMNLDMDYTVPGFYLGDVCPDC